MINIGIFGICGRMGMRIAALSLEDKDLNIVAGVDIEGHPSIGKDIGVLLDMEDMGVKVSSQLDEDNVDCMIDFTFPDATMDHIDTCVEKNIPMVIGTTAIGPEGEKKIKEASEKIPIVFSPNMSIGVNVLFNIVKEASRVLGKDFSIKIDETHHVHKKDSPSGTAKMIIRVIKESCGKDVPAEAFREGEVIGNHGIIFDNEFESLEIRHDAKTRDVFVAGALKAVKFLAGKSPALYTMKDVLGLE